MNEELQKAIAELLNSAVPAVLLLNLTWLKIWIAPKV